MGKKQKKSKRLPIMEQVILLAKEYKCNIIESKKMNKILSYIGGVYFFLFVILFSFETSKRSTNFSINGSYTYINTLFAYLYVILIFSD